MFALVSCTNLWVSKFHVLHLNYEKNQNIQNMSKTTRVYFGVLHFTKAINEFNSLHVNRSSMV